MTVETEALIRKACDDAIADGWTLQPGVTIDAEDKRCCPVGALAISMGFRVTTYYVATLDVQSFPLTSSEAGDLAIGFDLNEGKLEVVDREFGALGRRLRDDYVK